MAEFGSDNRLYFDDLQIGQRFTSRAYVVDEEQIKSFARQFDSQPFHLDHEAAKNSLFSGLAASGWHTAAITMRLCFDFGLHAMMQRSIVISFGEEQCPARLTLPN